MNRQEIAEKVKELMDNEQFTKKLANSENLDEMAALFQEEGIDVTGADLEAASETSVVSGELSETDLEDVSGGIAPIVVAGIIVFVGGSLLLGYIDGVKKKYKSCKR